MGSHADDAGRNTLRVGRVLRAHGLRGELRVQLYWADSQTLLQVDRVWLVHGAARNELSVRSARRSGRALLLGIHGIDDKDQADAMRDAEVVVERSLLPAPSAGEYYLADLVGAHVRAPDGDVGVVESIGIYPSADSLVIRTPSGERVEQPLEGGQVESIDIEAREVVLNSRQGLI